MRLWGLAACLFIPLLPSCGGGLDGDDLDEEEPTASETAELTVRNPVKSGCADPSVMRDGASYYLTCTGGDGNGNLFPIYRSSDLLTWTRSGEVFKTGQAPVWANGNWWAPELHHVGGKFVAVFSAKNKTTGKNAIGVASGTSPNGPFVDKGSPLASSPENSAIDAHLIVTSDGKPVLYYKGERSQNGQGADILRAMPLRADGLASAGAARTILTLSEPWEGQIIEAPWVIKRGGFYYLFYSGNLYCNSSYAVGVARSRDPFGPFEKRGAPILKSGSRWVGPGHNAVSQGPDGRTWIIYHAYHRQAEGTPSCNEPRADNDKRHTLVDRITWQGGWPRVVSNL